MVPDFEELIKMSECEDTEVINLWLTDHREEVLKCLHAYFNIDLQTDLIVSVLKAGAMSDARKVEKLLEYLEA